jgi:hypothetical protein
MLMFAPVQTPPAFTDPPVYTAIVFLAFNCPSIARLPDVEISKFPFNDCTVEDAGTSKTQLGESWVALKKNVLFALLLIEPLTRFIVPLAPPFEESLTQSDPLDEENEHDRQFTRSGLANEAIPFAADT